MVESKGSDLSCLYFQPDLGKMENESQAGPVDLDAIQAHLDMTMALTFDMVQSAMGRKPSDSLEVVVDPWAVREPRSAMFFIIILCTNSVL